MLAARVRESDGIQPCTDGRCECGPLCRIEPGMHNSQRQRTLKSRAASTPDPSPRNATPVRCPRAASGLNHVCLLTLPSPCTLLRLRALATQHPARLRCRATSPHKCAWWCKPRKRRRRKWRILRPAARSLVRQRARAHRGTLIPLPCPSVPLTLRLLAVIAVRGGPQSARNRTASVASATTHGTSRVKPVLRSGQRGDHGTTSWQRGSFFGMYSDPSVTDAAVATARDAAGGGGGRDGVADSAALSRSARRRRRRRNYRESLIRPEDAEKHREYELRHGYDSGGTFARPLLASSAR